jgi:hypothetical protein
LYRRFRCWASGGVSECCTKRFLSSGSLSKEEWNNAIVKSFKLTSFQILIKVEQITVVVISKKVTNKDVMK